MPNFGAVAANAAEYGSFVITFAVTGTLTTGVGAAKWPAPYACTIKTVYVAVGTAPTGAAVLVDVNKNGTTIFTTQSNRPTIAVSTTTDQSGTPDVTTLAAGDLVSVDVDQIGSTIAGADLVVAIALQPT